MPKRALNSAKMLRLVNHGPTVLVSSGHGGRNNIITLAWFMPVSMNPPMLAIAIGLFLLWMIGTLIVAVGRS